MQMIADGKIKEGQIINRIADNGDVYRYIFEDDRIRLYDGTDIFKIMPLCSMLSYHFEILEDTTEEIEELDTTAENTLFTMECYTGIPEKAQDWNFNILKNKIIEITRTVNKLNKQDTYKAENCMTD